MVPIVSSFEDAMTLFLLEEENEFQELLKLWCKLEGKNRDGV